MPDILIIDNHDSFTHNLAGLLASTGRSHFDIVNVNEIGSVTSDDFNYVLISPGPGLPEQNPALIDFIKQYASIKPMFGVCLGMQAMVVAFGGTLNQSKKIIHGEPCEMRLTNSLCSLFSDFPARFPAVRYHSWVVNEAGCPNAFNILCRDKDGQIMALQHKDFPLTGVQFHPESYKTEFGARLINNWFESQ